jgi:hypothetical protein
MVLAETRKNFYTVVRMGLARAGFDDFGVHIAMTSFFARRHASRTIPRANPFFPRLKKTYLSSNPRGMAI